MIITPDNPTYNNDNPLFQQVIAENKKLGRVIKATSQQNEVFKYLGQGVRIEDDSPEGFHITGNLIHYGGAKGGGKTCVGVAACVWLCKKYPGITCMVVRKTQKQANIQIIDVELLANRPQEIYGYKWYKQDKIARFYNKDGKLDESDCSRIIFQPIAREADTDKVYSNEFQFLFIDEAQLTEMDTIILMCGSFRGNIPGWIETALLNGNPGGISYDFFTTYWVNPFKHKQKQIEDPILPDYNYEEHWEKRFLKQKDRFKFVYASAFDNPYNKKAYLDNIDMQDSKTKAAWMGEYNSYQGRFFDEFREDKHVLRGSEQFEIPKHWERKVGFDLGEAASEDYVRHPTVFLWIAQDPETMALYVYRELVIKKFYPDSIYEVLGMCLDEDISEWISDPSTHSKKPDGGNNTYAEMFQSAGIFLKKASNERIPGWQALKAWLHWEGENKPLFYIFGDDCPFLVKTIPMMTHDTKKPEDMNSRKLDDAVDVARYLVYNGFRFPIKEIRDQLDFNKKIKDKGNCGHQNFIEQWIKGEFEEEKPKAKYFTVISNEDIDNFYKRNQPQLEENYDRKSRKYEEVL